MATTRLMPLHVGKGRRISKSIQDIINYVKNPSKTEQGELVTGFECDPNTAETEFMLAKREYIYRTGRIRGRDDVIAYHLRQSFLPGEITPEEANRIGCELASRFTHGNHAYIVATHTDKKHIHNHIIWSAVSLDCDRKFRNFWGSTKAVRQLSDTLCIQNGLSIVENPNPHGKSYDKWQGEQAKPSHRDMLRTAIDDALSQKPSDFDALLKLLQDAGWEIKRGKRISLRMPGQARYKRLDSLGDGYSEKTLRAVIAGEKKHSPAKKHATVGQSEDRVSLMIDIQAKLQQGKGAGYERWAKVFNLKQASRALNYLSEHSLTDYESLVRRTDEVIARYHALSDQIKSKERRIAEISRLKKHILEYIKTRDVYVAYRKAGYSKQFFAEHETEILLHKTAKKAFDELGIKKLPSMKQLQSEYLTLIAEKKDDYAEYRAAREEMRELLTVKANVDRLLQVEESSKDRQQQTPTV